MKPNVFVLIFLSTLSFSALGQAQDIGLMAGNSLYLTLDLAKPVTSSKAEYKGHVTTYDRTRGFLHSGVSGQITDSQKLSLTLQDMQKFKGLQAEYNRTVVERNTAWIRSQPCGPSCFNTLSGSTLQDDLGATRLLRYYEQNREKHSFSFRDYLGYSQSLVAFCGQGFTEFCVSGGQIGIVMDQSQVGAAKVVASALGLPTEVATFSVPRFNGAMVSASPEVMAAVFRSTGADLRDDVLNFSDWRVVSADQVSGLHPIALEITSDALFFDRIVAAPGDIAKINSEMGDFFNLMTGSNDRCRYDTKNSIPLFQCVVHSSDLNATGQAAWLKMSVVMTPFQADNKLSVVTHLYVERKYDAKSDLPTGQFFDINYNNADEAFLARLVKARVARTFRRFFQPNIEVRE